MKKNLLIISTCLMLIVVIALIVHHVRADSSIEGRALNVINSMQAGNYEAALKDFHVGAGSPAALGEQWKKTVALFGPMKQCTVTGTHATNTAGGKAVPGKTVELSLVFEKGTLYGHFPFDSGNQIVDLKLDSRPPDSDPQSDSVLVSRALNVIDSIQAGKYQDAQKDFTASMKTRMSAEVLGQVWTKMVAKNGQLKSRTAAAPYVLNGGTGQSAVPGAFKAVELTLVFEKGTLHGPVQFNPKQEVCGMQIR